MHFKEAISEHVWNIKYRYKFHHQWIDKSVEDMWERVASAAAKAEHLDQQSHWQKQFYSILKDFRFLPGGRIFAGAGTKHQVTLFNCFVMPVADSLNEIFDALKEGAISLQQGGGIGYDFSALRPKGSLVKKTDAAASGPVSFMKIWNAMCATMLSTGARRGAMMGVLRCDHPDIEEFIQAKSDPRELRHFNVSVLVSDAFIQAVKNNQDWSLLFPIDDEIDKDGEMVSVEYAGKKEKTLCRVYKRIKARELWQRIIKSAYDYAEPGVLFEDTINRTNNLWYREWITATNPCGEIPLPAYGACNLGAINLTQFVTQAFADNADLNWQELQNTTAIATRFLDNVIDISTYPLDAQKKEAIATRRIGLGITGLADTFVMLNIKYGSSASLTLAEKIMKTIATTTWQTSIDLAKERGVFPFFEADNYLQGGFVETLSDDIKQQIKKIGIRNSHHNTIAPTGTISLLANNVSNGLEPIFAQEYERTVRTEGGELLKFTVQGYALREWQNKTNSKDLPPAWSEVGSLTPNDHLQIQRIMQPYIDNAISKTINIPEDFPFASLAEVYDQAHGYGLKGCTVFRPNPITGSVLKTVTKEQCDRCSQF